MESVGDNEIIQHPFVVIEVLSPQTEAYDRGKKFGYFRDCPTVQEILLVSTQKQAVDLYRRATGKLGTLHPHRTGDDAELKNINVIIPIVVLHEKVKF